MLHQLVPEVRAFGVYLLAVLVSLWLTIQPAFAEEKPPRRMAEDKQFELIDIPLAPWPRGGMLDYEPTFYGFWLDNNHLVMSVLQDVPEAYAKHLERIVMIDARNGSYRVLVEHGSLGARGIRGCWNREREVMHFSRYNDSYYLKNPEANWKGDRHFVRLDSTGRIDELTGDPPIDLACTPPEKRMEKPSRLAAALQQGDGYIDKSDPGDFKNFRYGTAKLVRPGKEPIELGIPTVAVRWPVYLPYFDKYLMTTAPYGDALRTHSEFRKNHPGDGPYYLVGLDGSVASVPYPTPVLRQYGFPGFSDLWPTPLGVLININGGPLAPESGLFLLQGEELVRIWGGNPNLFSRRRGTLERSYVLNISPDGCRVVFLHARKYPLPKDKNPAPIPISILNICKEQ